MRFRNRQSLRRAVQSVKPVVELLELRRLLTTVTASTTSDLIADINAGNAAGAPYTIDLINTTYDFTASNNNNNGPNALPSVTGNITIVGNGAVIQRDSSSSSGFRLFELGGSGNLTLSNLTLTGGSITGANNAGGYGGAIYDASTGTLSISNCVISNNAVYGGNNFVSGEPGEGGGIYNADAGAINITQSTLSGNVAQDTSGYEENPSGFGAGGAIFNQGAGPVTISNSTLSSNSAVGAGGGFAAYGGSASGGAIENYGAGSVKITSSTLTQNSATGGSATGYGGGNAIGGGIGNSSTGTVTITSSTLSGNTVAGGSGTFASSGSSSGADINASGDVLLQDTIVADSVSGTLDSSSSYNVLVGTSPVAGLSDGTNGNIVVANASALDLGTLANYGGPTQTIALLNGSRAIGAGTAISGIFSDQRGYGPLPSSPDIGAYQTGAVAPETPSLVVTTTADTLFGTGTSLREAVAYAESLGGSQTVTFASSLTSSSAATITLTQTGDSTAGSSALGIDSNITIQGPTTGNGITLSANDAQRLFYVAAGASFSLDDLTITGGNAQGGNSGYGGGAGGLGGAVFVNGGTLTAVGVTFTSNTAQGGSSGNGNFGGAGGLGGDGSNNGGGPNGGTFTGSTDGGFGGGGAVSFATGGNGGVGGGGGFGDDGGGSGGFGGGGGGSLNGSGGSGGFGGGNGQAGGGNTGLGGGGAGLGGAVFENGGTVNIINSTFTQNSATGGSGGNNGQGYGGAIFDRDGTLNITFSTLSSNTAADGGRDLYVLGDDNHSGGDPVTSDSATANIADSILAQADTNINDLVANQIGSNGSVSVSVTSSLVGSASPDPSIPHYVGEPSVNFDTASMSLLGDNPSLGSLANNGGPTQTLALEAASPAIGAGTAADYPGTTTPITIDQRGVTRAATPSIGAFEYAPPIVTAGATVNYSLSGSAVATDSALTITDGESTTLASATVSIGSGFAAGDVLSDTTAGAIITSYNSATGVLSLSGTDTLANYQKVLDSIAFSTSSSSVGERTIDYSVSDGTLSSNTATSNVLAGSLVVNNAGDGSTGNTLRDAIAYAEAIGGGTVTFASALKGEKITLGGSQLELSSTGNPITIDASGIGGITISGDDASRVFQVDSGATVTLNDLTLTDGNVSQNTTAYGGGAIANLGTLILSDDTLTGNTATGEGGGIANYGSLTVNSSTISDNQAIKGLSTVAGAGGAISNHGTLSIVQSTISGNSAALVGAIYSGKSGNNFVDITGSTIFGNTGLSGPGVVLGSSGPLTITDSTIDGNSSGNNDAAVFAFGSLDLANTIVANSTGGEDVYADSTITGSNNLVDDGSDGLSDTIVCGQSTPGSAGQLWRTDPDNGPPARQSGDRCGGRDRCG
jgi:CSLREA domain-containing protein